MIDKSSLSLPAELPLGPINHLLLNLLLNNESSRWHQESNLTLTLLGPWIRAGLSLLVQGRTVEGWCLSDQTSRAPRLRLLPSWWLCNACFNLSLKTAGTIGSGASHPTLGD